MALNPAFASASVNPSQSIGSDASAPAQGALPTGMNSQGFPIGDALPNGYNVMGQQNTGFSGLGGQANQPQYTMPLNQPSAPDVSENAYQRYAGQQTLAGGATQQYGDWANSQAYGGIPMNYQPSSAQGMAMPFNLDGTRNPMANYLNAGPELWNTQPGAPTFEQYQANPSVATEFQNKQAQQPNYALQSPTEFVGQIPQQSLQQDPPSRYTYFGNDKTDYSQLGLSQTALDSLNMMRQAPDSGQFYYDTQTKTFGEGMGLPGPNIPGQRRYIGKTGIPLELMNKLGGDEYVDFSKYAQYDEGMPLPTPDGTTLQDIALQEPIPVQQPGPTSPTPPLAPQQPVQQPQVLNGVTGTPASPLTPTATPTGTTPMATNPLSQLPVAQTAAYTPAPIVGTPSSGGGSFTQGAPLPNITTTQQQVTAAPEFYTDYLNQLAKQGASTAQNAQYVGATDLQNQAFDRTSQNVGNYQSALQNAINLAQNVGSSNLSEAIGNLGQANIARNLAPQATAGIVGSGQFGSKRGAAALGDTIANAQLGITAQQAQALQQDMQNRLAASQQLGNLASSTQQLGLGDINALATMGGQKQTIAQNEQLFPMQQLTNQSQLLRGYTIPTSTGSSYTGPIPGAYAASPLQQIAGLGALGAGISQTKLGDAIGNLIGGTPAASKAAQAALSSLFNIGSKSPNVTTSTTIGDVSASIKTLPDGTPNPNYDAYADPNATDADRLQQNLMNTPVNPDIDNFDYSNIPSVTDEFDYSGFPE